MNTDKIQFWSIYLIIVLPTKKEKRKIIYGGKNVKIRSRSTTEMGYFRDGSKQGEMEFMSFHIIYVRLE